MNRIFSVTLPLALMLIGHFGHQSEGKPAPYLSCVLEAEDPPGYYSMKLISTRRIPGSHQATGDVSVQFASSPFSVSLNRDGSYRYKLGLQIKNLKPQKSRFYVAWITTPELDEIIRLGVLDDQFRLNGTTKWNKFLVVITMEDRDDAGQKRWNGPVILRGMSRSGLMHSMAGHGPFQNEPCNTYGYN